MPKILFIVTLDFPTIHIIANKKTIRDLFNGLKDGQKLLLLLHSNVGISLHSQCMYPFILIFGTTFHSVSRCSIDKIGYYWYFGLTDEKTDIIKWIIHYNLRIANEKLYDIAN